MGRSDERTLTSLLNTSDLFIAPIENHFGAKMKVMECLSRGTPILATSGALTGVSFKDLIPQFSLENADGAAERTAGLLNNKGQLVELSRMLTTEHAKALRSRNDSWRELIAGVKTKPCRSIPRFPMPSRPVGAKCLDLTQAWPKSVEVGVEEPMGVIKSGMHALEKLGREPLRWTSEIAEVEVPLNQGSLPTALNLQLFAIAPSNGTEVRLFVNGPELFRSRVCGTPISQTVPLPDLTGVPCLRLRLESVGWQSQGDVRQLGVAIKSIALSR